MITDEDPLQGLLFYKDLGISHTLHVLVCESLNLFSLTHVPERGLPLSQFRLRSSSLGGCHVTQKKQGLSHLIFITLKPGVQ